MPELIPEPLPRLADPGTVDADNPWPGLASFREADRELFFGRELETQELLRLVLRERLTVLFGLSGLGKTSLLRAGLFPLLREENVLPVYVRLDFSEQGEGTLADQVRQAILREAQAAGIEAPAFPESETLWESLHRQGAELWSPRNRIVTPLLVLDQFEEVFTLGRGTAPRAQSTEAFLAELADLCEGSVPAGVRERLEADPEAARDFSFARHPYKILLSLREDFLPELEGLRGRIRSIVQNRLRLRRMNGDNALRAVTRAGGHLVEPDVPDRVVRFVAAREGDGEVPLAGLEIEPALLSVVCRELNNKRRALGLPRITAGLVSGNRDEILSGLYERSVEDLGPEVRSFIEERLLTKSGFRDTVALENAVELPGVTREALDRLTDRRLLRIEDRGGQQRLELTHDVLTGVIRKSRDLRREQEAGERAEVERRETERKLRRSRLVIALLALVLIGVVALAAWGVAAQRQAREALADSDLERARNLQDSAPAHALAFLARAIRAEPESVAAQSLLSDLLLYRSWPRPIAELRFTDVDSVHLNEDGRIFAAVTETGRIRLYDTRTLRMVGEVRQSDAVNFLGISGDGRRILIIAPVTAQLWDARTGRKLGSFELGEKSHAQLSPDGQWLALARDDRTLILWQSDTGVKHRISFPPRRSYDGFGFSPDSRTIFAHGSRQVLLWDVRSGRSLPSPPESGPVEDVSFSPDSRHVLIVGEDAKHGMLWDVVAGAPVAGTFTRASAGVGVWRSAAGRKVATYGGVGATIWSSRDLEDSFGTLESLLRAELSRDGQLLLITSEERVELRDAATGRRVIQALCDCSQAYFLAGTRRIVTADDSGVVRVWNIEAARSAGKELLRDPGQRLSPVFSQDGSRLAVRNRDGRVRLWDTDTVQPVGEPIQGASSFELSPDGSFLLDRRKDHTLQLWDVRTGRPAWQPLPAPGTPDYAVQLNQAAEIVGMLGSDSAVRLWSLATGLQVGKIPQDPQDPQDPKITKFAFSPGGDQLATVSRKGVRTWDSRTGQPLRELQHFSPVVSLAFSPDGKRIATGTYLGLARTWNLESGELLVGPLRHRHGVLSIQFRPASRLLLTHARDVVRLWDDQTGLPIGESIGSGDRILYAELSPDAARILVNSEKEGVGLLDARTGQRLVSTRSLPSNSGSARFSPNGRLLWVASPDHVDVFAVPLFPRQDRELLARWAEAAGGWTLDDEGRLEEIHDQVTRLNALRRETAQAPVGQLGAASLIRWFLSNPKTRAPSPVIGGG
jgi:WD40 repeat protein